MTGPTRTLADLIADYRHCAAEFESLDPAYPHWADHAAVLLDSLQQLLKYRPADIAEFADKFGALIEATADDSEFHILRVLLSDARRLAEGGDQ